MKAGYGCAIIPEGIIDTSPGSGLKLIPLDPPLIIHSRLAWKRHQPLTKACEIFLACLNTRIQERKAREHSATNHDRFKLAGAESNG